MLGLHIFQYLISYVGINTDEARVLKFKSDQGHKPLATLPCLILWSLSLLKHHTHKINIIQPLYLSLSKMPATVYLITGGKAALVLFIM